MGEQQIKTRPEQPVEVDAAALHMARISAGDGRAEPDVEAIQRWKIRIRVWRHRYPDDLRKWGRRGRTVVVDLVELEALARKLGAADA